MLQDKFLFLFFINQYLPREREDLNPEHLHWNCQEVPVELQSSWQLHIETYGVINPRLENWFQLHWFMILMIGLTCIILTYNADILRCCHIK